jgi:acetate kinase
MSMHLMTVNAGSSSVKFGIYRLAEGAPEALCKAIIDRADTAYVQVRARGLTSDQPLGDPAFDSALPNLMKILAATAGIPGIDAVAHRIVHGGDHFSGAARVDDDVLSTITSLVPLAPLHQPQSLTILAALRRLYPDLPQVACFDTAFHQTQPDQARRFAIPRPFHDAGIKRYGFHGLSYDYISGELQHRDPELALGRVVAAHLGSGASLCALKSGSSLDCSMGFSTLDGIPMATRCGRLDPGVVLHLLKECGMSLNAVEHMLYHRSGLQGLSGVSGDMRDLLASPHVEAWQAVLSFSQSVAREAAALTAMLRGVDGIVFTAGIGERMPQIRSLICGQLDWLGIELDPDANSANAFCISRPGSQVKVLVLPTDEELVIARQAEPLLQPT